MTVRATSLAAAFGVVLLAAQALAVESPVSGRKLLIKDRTQPGTASRKIVFASREPSVLPSAPGSSGDPTTNGGSVEVFNSAGSGEEMVIPLAAANWSAGTLGWKYRAEVVNRPAQDYRIVVVVRRGRLKVVVTDEVGSLVGYTLDEASQGSVGLRLSTGADAYCADFGGVIRLDESEDLGDGVYRGAFAAKSAPAPASCAGSPSGAFVD